MVHARIDNFQLDPAAQTKAALDAAEGGARGLMGAESWVTAKVHQRIDSLWRPQHTQSYGPISRGI